MFAFVLGFSSLCLHAAGHAYLTQPIGRQLAASSIQGAHGAPEFDKQSWSGKGAGNFIANCGSPTFDGKYEDVPEKWVPRRTFVTGQVVDFVITFTAQHNGAHGFRMICADDRLQERLPPFTDAAWTNLKRNREDPNHMTDFQKLHFTENDWDTMAFIPQAFGNNPATVQFVIPADFSSCNHAVIQWWWKTANSCTPRLFHGQRGQFTEDANLGECNVVAPSDDCIDGDCQMEQFNNCADVVIIGGNSSVSSTSSSDGGRPTSRTMTTTLVQSSPTTTAKFSNTFTSLNFGGDSTTSLTTTAEDGSSSTSVTARISPSTTSFAILNCHALSNQATDQWCTDNCNHIPAFCPPTFCVCENRSFRNDDGPCSGEPCSDISLCRSRWGYCGSSLRHCDDASIWKVTGCAPTFHTASIRMRANASAANYDAAILSKACCSFSNIIQTVAPLLIVWFSID